MRGKCSREDVRGASRGVLHETARAPVRGQPTYDRSVPRDAFRLLLGFAYGRLHKAPSDILLADIDASFVSAFLDELETKRKNSARTRNARLAAIHSFFRFAILISCVPRRIVSVAARPGHGGFDVHIGHRPSIVRDHP